MYLLVDNYDSFSYNLKALVESCGGEVDVIRNDAFRDPSNCKGIIISPGPSTPENAGTSNRYIGEYAGRIPLFGVCLGMQCIGHYLGYRVDRASIVMHGKADTIRVQHRSVLFRGLPDSFRAIRYHSLAVKGAEEIATARGTADECIMAIEDRDRMLFGVQFHPESILSEYGREIMTNFMRYTEGI